MADNRKIIHGVRLDNKTVITDVDELAKVMTPELQERLEKSGSITGDWGKAKRPEVQPLSRSHGG